MKRNLLFTLLLGVVLVLAACSGNNSDQQSESGSKEDSAPASQIDITASNFEFDQDEYIVNAGEEIKVTLTNAEGMHGIAIDGLDVSIEGEGEVTFTPDEPGEYTIYCNIPCGQGHDEMKSTLVVQ